MSTTERDKSHMVQDHKLPKAFGLQGQCGFNTKSSEVH